MGNPLQENLRWHLTQKKLSAHSLEKKAGLKPSAVQNILQGKSKRPAASLLQAIASEIGCTIEDLLEDESPQAHPQNAPTKDWNLKLYANALHTVQALLEKKGLILSKEETLKCVDEIYLYSIKSSEEIVDERFADWLVGRAASLGLHTRQTQSPR